MISLKPRRGQVSLFLCGNMICSFQGSYLRYQGPLCDPGSDQTLGLDQVRGKVPSNKPNPWPVMELSGFASGLGFNQGRECFPQADRLDIVWAELGTIRLERFKVGEVNLKAQPNGVFFTVQGEIRGAIRRLGWV